MRFTGTLQTWHDDRGFGFIAPSQGGQPLFVHIKSFPPGTGRPAVGQVLSFEVGSSADGRKRALAVQYPSGRASASRTGSRVSAQEDTKAGRSPRPHPSTAAWSPARRLALPLLAVVYAGAVWRWGFDVRVPLVYGGLSLVALLVYAVDKSAAVRGAWRVPENTLHALSLAGGWPGALLAQQGLRHKTAKTAFILVFWATVAGNLIGLLAWHAHQAGAGLL